MSGKGSAEHTMLIKAPTFAKSGRAWRPFRFSNLEKVSKRQAQLLKNLEWMLPTVRSTGEVFMHIAQANYSMPLLLGEAPAPGVDPKTFDAQARDKAKVVETLRGSFDYAMKALRDLPDADLEQGVDIFGRQGTKRELCMLLVAHAHEHLGQSIAYARTNGIVPPWTARAEAAAAAAKKKADAK